MAEVITFQNFRPPARYDEIPWTSVRIEESADGLDPWAQIDEIPLDPLDADPSQPALRSFTTENGTALEYWYRIIFADGTSDTSQPTAPIQNVAGSGEPVSRGYATTSELARILRLRAPTADQLVAMQRVLDAAALEIDQELGRGEPYTVAPALVVEVNLERAVEHWQQQESPFGIIGLGDAVPTATAKDSFDRHAYKLAPLKEGWGIG